jgi:hypothetical protein
LPQSSFPDEPMDAFHSPAFVPVCDRLKSVFEPALSTPAPNELDRLLQALDDAYMRGELFGAAQAIRAARLR